MIRLAHQGWVHTTEVLCHDRLLTMEKKKKEKKKRDPLGLGRHKDDTPYHVMTLLECSMMKLLMSVIVNVIQRCLLEESLSVYTMTL